MTYRKPDELTGHDKEIFDKMMAMIEKAIHFINDQPPDEASFLGVLLCS